MTVREMNGGANKIALVLEKAGNAQEAMKTPQTFACQFVGTAL